MDGFIDYILENKWRNILIAVGILALVPILYMSYRNTESKYLLDGENVIGVFGRDKGISIRVEASRNDVKAEREVLLIKREGEAVDGLVDGETDETKVDELIVGSTISQTVKKINSSAEEGELFILPKEGGNGVALKWSKPEMVRTFLLPLPAVPLVFLYMYRDSADKKKQRLQRERDEILMTIPGFSDRLLLLLSCGLIYEDAFSRIAEGYRQGEPNAFGQLVIKAYEESAGTNNESIAFLSEYAGKLKIKEFSRLTGIIADNRYRGADLSEKLRQESRLLWSERKKKAEEMGRKAETKLSGPMALMLIVLIAVTAAPALMQV